MSCQSVVHLISALYLLSLLAAPGSFFFWRRSTPGVERTILFVLFLLSTFYLVDLTLLMFMPVAPSDAASQPCT